MCRDSKSGLNGVQMASIIQLTLFLTLGGPRESMLAVSGVSKSAKVIRGILILKRLTRH